MPATTSAPHTSTTRPSGSSSGQSTRIDAPQFREFTKHHHTSRGNIDMEALKYRIRAAYKGRVHNYTHDVTMHAGDNREQALHVERLLLFNASKAFRDTAARADAACDAPQTRLR
mmetsp:Transcript_32140/g.103138  ORF Transcript_32140/g.103138 Transcript_32140/m.103138 type:complete len:115 (+) Transcript_32140:252-596(+)